MGSGCDRVGRGDTSDARDSWFESQHRQNFQICLSIPYSREDKKEKEAEIGQLKANNHDQNYVRCVFYHVKDT